MLCGRGIPEQKIAGIRNSNVPVTPKHPGSSTGWLQTTWNTNGGETFKLTFHLQDTADYRLDSQVILDAFRFKKEEGEENTIIIE